MVPQVRLVLCTGAEQLHCHARLRLPPLGKQVPPVQLQDGPQVSRGLASTTLCPPTPGSNGATFSLDSGGRDAVSQDLGVIFHEVIEP